MNEYMYQDIPVQLKYSLQINISLKLAAPKKDAGQLLIEVSRIYCSSIFAPRSNLTHALSYAFSNVVSYTMCDNSRSSARLALNGVLAR
jgi:hypothetical protein